VLSNNVQRPDLQNVFNVYIPGLKENVDLLEKFLGFFEVFVYKNDQMQNYNS